MDSKNLEDSSKVTIEELEGKLKKEIRKRRRNTTILIIIIIILLLFHFALYKLGKIGYGEKTVTSDPTESIVAIKLTQNDIDITKENRNRYI